MGSGLGKLVKFTQGNVGMAEYFHVCPGTPLRRIGTKDGTMLLSLVGPAFFKHHLIDAYADCIYSVLDGLSRPRSIQDVLPRPQAPRGLRPSPPKPEAIAGATKAVLKLLHR